jgi:hypothetical protein
MSNNIRHARLAATWCLTMMAIGAAGIVLGAALTVANGGMLLAACVVPPTVMLVVWNRLAPVALPVAS